MKIFSLPVVFSPLAFFYALCGEASAQVVVVSPVISPHQIQFQGQSGKPVVVQHPVHSAHAFHPHHPVACGINPYAYYQRPSVYVGPELVRFSTGPGNAVSSVPDVSTRPVVARPNPTAWMNMGMPEGGPVGTWFEDATTPGNIYQYTISAKGTYERYELKKNASGPMTLVKRIPRPMAFSFGNGSMALDPKGAYEEGPYEVHMSANTLGATRVTLKDAANGRIRVWRDKP